jgi:hypothetical protein
MASRQGTGRASLASPPGIPPGRYPGRDPVPLPPGPGYLGLSRDRPGYAQDGGEFHRMSPC